MNNPIKTTGFVRFRLNSKVGSMIFISSIYEESRARAVRAAEPIANPYPVAAVVLPNESSASVLTRTSSSSPAICAIPPALSATGP